MTGGSSDIHPPVDAYIALGSNLGDRAAHLDAACSAIDAIRGTRILDRSRIRETDPVGPPGQSAYLNAAVRVRTSLLPERLLDELLRIERENGRTRPDAQRWGPRTLDLDLLIHGESILHLSNLTLPHPRLHERRFVLEPLCDLAPDLVVPGVGRTVRELLAIVAANGP